MTEYALILATIAVAAYGAYKAALGNSIGTLASDVESKLRKRTVELETSEETRSASFYNWGSGLDLFCAVGLGRQLLAVQGFRRDRARDLG